jgi:hypothetical protein
MMTGAPTGYIEHLRRVVRQAFAARQAECPDSFGFDPLDTIELGFDAFGYDVVDVINAGQTDIPTLCTQCRKAWLMGPEAQAAGKCWSCRTGGGVA